MTNLSPAPGPVEGTRIRLEPLAQHEEYSRDLWQGMLTDAPLREALGGAPAPASLEEFLETGRRWAEKTGGLTFAVVSKESGKAFGSITLSRFDEPAANVGYYLASRVWGQGLGGEAFGLILQVARAMGLSAVKTDHVVNEASMRIWRRRGAKITRRPDGAFSCWLSIKTST